MDASLHSRRVLGELWRAKDISEDATLLPILDRLGVESRATLVAANTPENKDALRRQTEEAASHGLFGAPSFTVGEELFWGNDRLEAALLWAKARRKA